MQLGYIGDKLNHIKSKLLSVFLIFFLIVKISSATIVLVPGTTAYLPITFTNNQIGATNGIFEMPFIFNSNSIKTYLANNLNNTGFQYGNGTIINGQLEYNNTNSSLSSEWWVRLTSPIAASGGTQTIYMDIFSHTTNFGPNTGEQALLSPIYNQYDIGNTIFPLYSSFGGSNLDTNLFSVKFGTPIVSNSLRLMSGFGQNGIAIKNTYNTTNMIFDVYLNAVVPTLSGNNFMYGWAGTVAGVKNVIIVRGFGTTQAANVQTANALNNFIYKYTIPQSGNVVESLWANSVTDFFGNSLPGNILAGSFNSFNNNVYLNNTNSEQILMADNVGGNTGNDLLFYWVRIRDAPPQNIFPITTFGSVANALIINSITATNNLKFGQIQTLKAIWRNGTANFNGIYTVSNSIGVCTTKTFNNIATSTNSYSYSVNSLCGTGAFTANIVLTDSESPQIQASNSVSYIVGSTGGNALLLVSNTIVIGGNGVIAYNAIDVGSSPFTYNFIVYNGVSGSQVANLLVTGITANSYVWQWTPPASLDSKVTEYHTSVSVLDSTSTTSNGMSGDLYVIAVRTIPQVNTAVFNATITNNQSVNSISGLQLQFTLNTITYNPYLRNNGGNIRFANIFNGTYYNSILEGCLNNLPYQANIVNCPYLSFYIKIPFELSSGSISFPSNTKLALIFNGVTNFDARAGEAAYLSTPYGVYDTGNIIFPYYVQWGAAAIGAPTGANVYCSGLQCNDAIKGVSSCGSVCIQVPNGNSVYYVPPGWDVSNKFTTVTGGDSPATSGVIHLITQLYYYQNYTLLNALQNSTNSVEGCYTGACGYNPYYNGGNSAAELYISTTNGLPASTFNSGIILDTIENVTPGLCGGPFNGTVPVYCGGFNYVYLGNTTNQSILTHAETYSESGFDNATWWTGAQGKKFSALNPANPYFASPLRNLTIVSMYRTAGTPITNGNYQILEQYNLTNVLAIGTGANGTQGTGTGVTQLAALALNNPPPNTLGYQTQSGVYTPSKPGCQTNTITHGVPGPGCQPRGPQIYITRIRNAPPNNIMPAVQFSTQNSKFVLTNFALTKPVVQKGDTEVLSATISGGVSNYIYDYEIKNATNGNVIANAVYNIASLTNSFTFILPSTANDLGTLNINFTVRDAEQFILYFNTTIVLVANPLLTAAHSPIPFNTPLNIVANTIIASDNLNLYIDNGLVTNGIGSINYVAPSMLVGTYNILVRDTNTLLTNSLVVVGYVASNVLTATSAQPNTLITPFYTLNLANTVLSNSLKAMNYPLKLFISSPNSTITYNLIVRHLPLYSPMQLQDPNATVYFNSVTLTNNIYAYDITINPFNTVTTNGYALIATNMIKWQGANIITGQSGPTSVAFGGSLSFVNSCGGSGGGGADSAAGMGGGTSYGKVGGSTKIAGGVNTTGNGANGNSVNTCSLTNTLINSWIANGISQYLAGAKGGDGGQTSGITTAPFGGPGEYGLYVQANIVIAGNVYTAATNGVFCADGGNLCGGGGGGGAGTIIIANGLGGYTKAGTFNTLGGFGGAGTNAGGSGGFGGNGLVVQYPFSGSNAPIPMSGTRVQTIGTNMPFIAYLPPPSQSSGNYVYNITELGGNGNSILLSMNVSINMTDVNSAITFNNPVIQYFPNAAYCPTFTVKTTWWRLVGDKPQNNPRNTSTPSCLDIFSNANITFPTVVQLNYTFVTFNAFLPNNPALQASVTQSQFKILAQNSIPAFPYNALTFNISSYNEQTSALTKSNTTFSFTGIFNNYTISNQTIINAANAYAIYRPLGNFINPSFNITSIISSSVNASYFPAQNNFCPVVLNSTMSSENLAIYLVSYAVGQSTQVNLISNSGGGQNGFFMQILYGASSLFAKKVQQLIISGEIFQVPLIIGGSYSTNIITADCKSSIFKTSPTSIGTTWLLSPTSNNTVPVIGIPNVAGGCSLSFNSVVNANAITCNAIDSTGIVNYYNISLYNSTGFAGSGFNLFASNSIPGNSFVWQYYPVSLVHGPITYKITWYYGGQFDPPGSLTGVLNNIVTTTYNTPLNTFLTVIFMIVGIIVGAATGAAQDMKHKLSNTCFVEALMLFILYMAGISSWLGPYFNGAFIIFMIILGILGQHEEGAGIIG